MSILDNIILLMNIQHKQQKELTDFLGLHKNAFTDWKNGKSKSYEKYLYQIAAFLGVSVDYLLGNTDSPTDEQTSIMLSYDEIQLIHSYRSHPELQEAVNRILLPNKTPEIELQIPTKKESLKLAADGGDFKAQGKKNKLS